LKGDFIENLQIIFNQPNLHIWHQEEELVLLLNNLRSEPFNSESCREAFKNLLIDDDLPINNKTLEVI
jgi:hypothetical protein